jgi:hypothetical protein
MAEKEREGEKEAEEEGREVRDSRGTADAHPSSFCPSTRGRMRTGSANRGHNKASRSQPAAAEHTDNSMREGAHWCI